MSTVAKRIGAAALMVATMSFAVTTHAETSAAAQLGEFLEHIKEHLREQVRIRLRPTRRDVTWRARYLADLSLAAPIVAYAVADIDGNGQDDLILTTAEELLIVEVGRTVNVLSRVTLPVSPPATMPRDVIGSLSVSDSPAGRQIRVRTSEQSTGTIFGWRDGALHWLKSEPGYPVCERSSIERAPGRNFFAAESLTWRDPDQQVDVPKRIWTLSCAGWWPNLSGDAVAAFASISDRGVMTVVRRVKCLDARNCDKAIPLAQIAGVGTAFAIDDVAGDGRGVAIFASDRPHGRSDSLHVHRIVDGKTSEIFTQALSGGVEVVAIGNFAGTGKRAVAVVRLKAQPSSRVQVWSLE